MELDWAFGFNSIGSRGAVHYSASADVVIGAGCSGVVIRQVCSSCARTVSTIQEGATSAQPRSKDPGYCPENL